MRYSDLVKAYRKLSSIRSDSLFSDDVPEKVVRVYETNRIRILLLRTLDDPGKIKMEVEVTLPERIRELNATRLSDEMLSSDQPALRHSLEELVLLYQYLLRLQQAGFRLDFFGEEGVWSASYDMQKVPTKGFFSRLQPPEEEN